MSKSYLIAIFVAALAVIAIIFGAVSRQDRDTDDAIPSGNENQTTVQNTPREEESSMKVNLIINDEVYPVTMHDNETARDFLSLLPLTLKLEDYAGTEKIGYPPRKLSTEGAPAGSDPSVGDIAYYAPWGNLAIYYKDFGYSKDLIILGKIDNGIEVLARSDTVDARFERAE